MSLSSALCSHIGNVALAVLFATIDVSRTDGGAVAAAAARAGTTAGPMHLFGAPFVRAALPAAHCSVRAPLPLIGARPVGRLRSAAAPRRRGERVELRQVRELVDPDRVELRQVRELVDPDRGRGSPSSFSPRSSSDSSSGPSVASSATSASGSSDRVARATWSLSLSSSW
jgi:hypothetical protein